MNVTETPQLQRLRNSIASLALFTLMVKHKVFAKNHWQIITDFLDWTHDVLYRLDVTPPCCGVEVQ